MKAFLLTLIFGTSFTVSAANNPDCYTKSENAVARKVDPKKYDANGFYLL